MIVRPGPGPLLYSCNHAAKFYIHQRYRAGIHYAWVSEYYDTRTLPAGLPFSKVPKSSNPAVLYRDYHEAVDPWDSHDSHILHQKTSLKALAARWRAADEINDLQLAEIFNLVDRDEPEIWKPLLYVIPRTPDINNRLTTVPPAKRAGLGSELIIPDLAELEFDVIEFLA